MTLPVTFKLPTLAAPAVLKLPPVMLPVVVIIPVPVFNVPAILTPVPEIVNIVLPTAAMVTLPFAVAILMLLLPFA